MSLGRKSGQLARKKIAWSSPDPDGLLAWHLHEEAPELLKMFQGHAVVNVEVHFFVNQFATDDRVTELHPVTMTFDGTHEDRFWSTFWMVMRDARRDLVETRGLRLDWGDAGKYVVPFVVRMWTAGGRSQKTMAQ